MANLGVRTVGAQPAYEQVAAQLRGQILAGEIAQGDRLPKESELAELFEVSRSTIREALRSLASQQLVVTSRGVNGGTQVSVPAAAGISDYLGSSIEFLALGDAVSVAELLETRMLLEVPATRLAATRATPAALALIEGTLASPSERGRAEEFETNEGFHLAVLRASGNRLIEMLTCPLFNVLRDRFLDDTPRGFWRRVHGEHAQIHQAIAQGDPDAAGRGMEDHLARLADVYERIERRLRKARPA